MNHRGTEITEENTEPIISDSPEVKPHQKEVEPEVSEGHFFVVFSVLSVPRWWNFSSFRG